MTHFKLGMVRIELELLIFKNKESQLIFEMQVSSKFLNASKLISIPQRSVTHPDIQ